MKFYDVTKLSFSIMLWQQVYRYIGINPWFIQFMANTVLKYMNGGKNEGRNGTSHSRLSCCGWVGEQE